MKIKDIFEKLEAYPPESELEIWGSISKNPCIFYVDGTYILSEFDNSSMIRPVLTPITN